MDGGLLKARAGREAGFAVPGARNGAGWQQLVDPLFHLRDWQIATSAPCSCYIDADHG